MSDFKWAANKVKLHQAKNALEAARKLDPRLEINEDSIRKEYVRRAGLIADIPPVQAAPDSEAESAPRRRAIRKESEE